jgi:hypothetical protein
MSFRKAILSRVTKDGLGYLVDKSSRQTLYFTFDKIPNYRGQSLSQLGIARGDDVTYEADEGGQVTSVLIPSKPHRKMFAF